MSDEINISFHHKCDLICDQTSYGQTINYIKDLSNVINNYKKIQILSNCDNSNVFKDG